MLTALGCAGSLAAMLAVSAPAVAAPATDNVDDSLPTLAQAESNPITDAIKCGCARCALGEMTPSL